MSSKISNNEVIILQVKGQSQPLHICFTEECRRSFVILSGLTICISIDKLASPVQIIDLHLRTIIVQRKEHWQTLDAQYYFDINYLEVG